MTKLPQEFEELYEWFKPLCRYHKLEDIAVFDYKNKVLRLKIFTKDHCYSISAKLPEKRPNSGGYVGCISSTRKPRAGEDWNRGNDLADGAYSKETFQDVIHDILAYELVKVVKPKHREAYLDKDSILRPSNDSSVELNSLNK